MKITNIRHLALKESNRLFSVAGQLNKLGARVKVDAKKGSVEVRRPLPEKIGSYVFFDIQTDHRVAMALALVGLRAGSITIRGSESISKSYPGFVRDMQAIGACIKEFSAGKQ